MMSPTRWQPSATRADMWKHADGRRPYRWVMIAIWFLMMTLNSVSLTAYPLALPHIAHEFAVSPDTFGYYAGILSYSLGLFIVYFTDIKGWMSVRVRLAIMLAQAVMIIPSFLLPLASSYPIVIVLRFVQGLWFIELGLATVQLKGWFRQSQIALALAAPLSALVVGSAIGGLLEKVLVQASSWQTGDYVTAGATSVATLIFFVFYRDAEGYRDFLVLSARSYHAARQDERCPASWRLRLSYMIGLSQLATTMAFASIPFLVPALGSAHRYASGRIADTVMLYGMLAALGVWAGALLGDVWTRTTSTAQATFRARNRTRTISQIAAFIGFALLLFGGAHYVLYSLGAVLAALILFNIPNYWAEMGEVTPPAVAGNFIFFSGAIASSGFFLGPLISIVLIVEAHSVETAFVLFLVIIALSEGVNLWQNTVRLPIDQYRLPESPARTE